MASGPHANGTVVAAGAVVLRKTKTRETKAGTTGAGTTKAGTTGTGQAREVLLVHRPKYDDWSFPKGKADPGEHVTAAAVREVLEETGVEVGLGRPLLRQTYAVNGGREKTVHYWVGRVVGDDDVSGYAINDEIDDVRWVPVDEAVRQLSYRDDVTLLDEAMTEPRRTRTLLVVRHGRAMKRDRWEGDDRRRPLTEQGRAQARALVPILHAYAVTRVVTSPSRRCVRTLEPYATEQVLPVETWPALSEEDATDDGVASAAADLLRTEEPTAVCSHRPVLPGLLSALGVVEEPLALGELVAIHHRKGRVVAAERHLPR